MAKTISIKPEEAFARDYADRLILQKLTEMESAMKLSELAERLSGDGLGLGAVRSLLASNPERFAYQERRWIPASRVAGTGRPFNEAVRVILDRFGGPMPLGLLLQELGRIRTEPDLDNMLGRTLEYDQSFVLTSNNLIALAAWGFQASDEPVERGLALNGISQEELSDAESKLKGLNWRKPESIAEGLKKAAPISLKLLGGVAWANLNAQDPRSVLLYNAREFTAAALSIEGYVFAPDGVLYPEEEAKKWISTAIKLAEKIAPTIDVEDAAPVDVKPDDVKAMVKKITAKDQTVTATKLLEDVYEITPSNKTFPDDLFNVMSALRGTNEVQWVGGDRFRKPNSFPDYILSVPEPFQFQSSEMRDDEGELIDVELTDDGLSSSLRKLLTHPLATDVLDEDILPAPKTMPDQVRLVLKSIHRELGTFPMSQIHTGWLDPQPNIQELIFIDPTGRELQVWLNHEARLLYNLIDWWYEQPVESGAVFSVAKTARPNVFDFAWLDQTDPVVYISSQRMEELRSMQERVDEMSTLDILVEVMGHWPKGADFLTILAEVNVVRRSTRRLIASLLSSYQAFYQRSGSPVWHFDPKKLDLGFDKTKKKFIKK
ncbi:MAG: hypothetical protein WAO58_04455 [Fimbriimonadaceae bacterium]